MANVWWDPGPAELIICRRPGTRNVVKRYHPGLNVFNKKKKMYLRPMPQDSVCISVSTEADDLIKTAITGGGGTRL